MVSILPSARTPWDVISASIGQNLEQSLPQVVARQQNLADLNRAQAEIAQANGDPFKIALAIAKGGANNPNLQRSLGPLAEAAFRARQMQGEANAPAASEIGGQREHEAPPSFQPLGSIGGEAPTNKIFPTNQPPAEGTGNLPQAATTNKVLPLRTPAERDKDTRKLNAERKKEGIVEPLDVTRKYIDQDEEAKIAHNSTVESEQEKRISGQRNYGDIGEKALVDVFPNATPEQKSIFKRKAEDAAAGGKSEAGIESYLNGEAKKFANTIKNVTADMTAPRVVESFKRKFAGTHKDIESASQDLRVKLKPLLDLGLYDTARDLLSDLNYYPEERDYVVNPLGERENIVLNRVPTFHPKYQAKGLPPAGGFEGIGVGVKREKAPAGDIKAGLKDLKNANPNFSLVLARKAFEDKNYDWREFKDALNEMILNNEFELTDDQRTQLQNLDSPPLNFLDKILHGLNIIGR